MRRGRRGKDSAVSPHRNAGLRVPGVARPRHRPRARSRGLPPAEGDGEEDGEPAQPSVLSVPRPGVAERVSHPVQIGHGGASVHGRRGRAADGSQHYDRERLRGRGGDVRRAALTVQQRRRGKSPQGGADRIQPAAVGGDHLRIPAGVHLPEELPRREVGHEQAPVRVHARRVRGGIHDHGRSCRAGGTVREVRDQLCAGQV
mmetsp:Transcript_22317/g.54058  ORF Transcript_22317/g.54058 Transcript_22317/m.54058 type:complete len:202 (-) Transcript_22317:205-810(-)